MVLRSCCTAVVASAFVLSPFVASAANYEGQLNPRNLTEMRRTIQDCEKQVYNAVDPEARSRCREELCKRLIQAEDYDAALDVARAVYQTPGINAERRAAHHFLIAQIYALKMKASPNVNAMEANRASAYQAARQVTAQSYPKAWMVTDSAQALMRELQDPKHMAEVRTWVQKRQSGGEDPGKMAAARRQSLSIERAVAGDRQPAEKKRFGFFGMGRSKATASAAVRQTAQPEFELPPTSPKMSLSPLAISSPGGVNAEIRRTSSAGGLVPSDMISRSQKRASLSMPIIIDGTSVRAAQRAPEAPLENLNKPLPQRGGSQVYAADAKNAKVAEKIAPPPSTDSVTAANRKKLAAIFSRKSRNDTAN